MKVVRVVSWALAVACVAIGAATADEMQMQAPAYALPQELVSAATAFDDYMTGAAKIGASFSDGDAVAQGLKTASAYEPSQLEEGMIGYGAIVALQDERFVAGVERAAGRGEDRSRFAQQLVEDPSAALRIDGADDAAQRIGAAVDAKATALAKAGAQVTTDAYAVQREPWSQAIAADGPARLAEVKASSSETATPSDGANQAMLDAIIAADPGTAGGSGGVTDYSQIEARALALAAESVLGRAHSADRDWLSPLFSEPGGAECLRMAKLDLYQCMAVAGPQYEDIYCMGQHAMTETARCVAGAAQGSGATQVASLAKRPDDVSLAASETASYASPPRGTR